MQELLDNLVKINLPLTHKGKVANYIPALARADIDNLGVCVIDMSGNSYASGDYRTLFTIQSISKTISFMLALLDTGEEKVFTKVEWKQREIGLILYTSWKQQTYPNL